MSSSFPKQQLSTSLSLSWDAKTPLRKIESAPAIIFSYPTKMEYGGVYGPDTDDLLLRLEMSSLDGTLNVAGLSLTSLPILPYTLQTLNISNTEISELPVLPEKLRSLSCVNTTIATLPRLPSGLRYLNITNTRIKVLPDLPDTLQSLCCSSTPIREIHSLPPRLQYLDCLNTNIEQMPHLPETLSTLKCAGPLTPLGFVPKKNTHSFSKSIGFV